jgi:TRAP transporter TAXI family solute receptor
MTGTRRRRALPGVLVAALLAGLLCATGCGTIGRVVDGLPGRGPDVPPGTVEIATGSTQGVYYRYGTALADVVSASLPGVRARVRSTEGSIENLRRVAAGQSTVAFTAADAAGDAVTGRGEFTKPLPVQAVARVYDDYLHLVVPADSPLRTAADLKGHRVSIGQAGSGTELIATRVLAALRIDPGRDITPAYLGINDSAEALHAGRIDAFFWSGGLPTAGVVSLARQLPIRLVPLGDLVPKLRQYSRTYRAATVPAGTYPGVAGVLTLAVPNYLVTRADTNADLVYQLTRLLFASRERLAGTVSLAGVLDARAAIETSPVMLHPGALRYFRDTKP